MNHHAWPTLKFKEDVRTAILKSLEKVNNFPSGEDKLRNLSKIGAKPPSFTTLRLNTLHHNIKDAVKTIKETLNEREINRSGLEFEVSVHPMISDCILIRNRGPFIVEPVTNEVVVDHSCGMSVLRGSDIFSTGILSLSPFVKVGDQVSIYVDLEHKCRRGSLPKDFTGDKLFIGNGIAMVTRSDIFCHGVKKLTGVGILVNKCIYKSPQLSDLLPSFIHPQNLPSIVCVHVLDPQQDDLVLDMCAAPGGKTSHIATLMNNKGCLVALDKNKNKTNVIKKHLSNWNITNTQVYHCDSRYIVDEFNLRSEIIHNSVDKRNDESGDFNNGCYGSYKNNSDGNNINNTDKNINNDTEKGLKFKKESFDKILLDAPCSALGQRPTIITDITSSQLGSYPKLQKQLFEVAVRLLKKGGMLVYSTCTSNVYENEYIVLWALQKFKQIKLVKQTLHVGGRGWLIDGLSEEQTSLIQRFDSSILLDDNDDDDDDTISNHHHHQDQYDIDTIGFFIAKFIKS